MTLALASICTLPVVPGVLGSLGLVLGRAGRTGTAGMGGIAERVAGLMGFAATFIEAVILDLDACTELGVVGEVEGASSEG